MKITTFSTIILILLFSLSSCKEQAKPTPEKPNAMKSQVTPNFKMEELGNLEWLNNPAFVEIEDGTLKIVVEKGTDFFNNPEDSSVTATAPLFFKQLTGDFVAKALVRPDFSSLWNAVALMIHIDNHHWIKFAFENSDATGKSIVSVVTKTVSDDANGVILNEEDQIWLKLVRKANIYSMLWSRDGTDFKMARLSAMPAVDSVKIGLEVQSPVGEQAIHEIHYFEIVETTVKDLRKGE